LDRIALQVNSALGSAEPALADIRAAVAGLRPLIISSITSAATATSDSPAAEVAPVVNKTNPLETTSHSLVLLESNHAFQPNPSQQQIEQMEGRLTSSLNKLTSATSALKVAADKLEEDLIQWQVTTSSARMLVAEVSAREKAATAAEVCQTTTVSEVTASILGNQPLTASGSVVVLVQAPSKPTADVSPGGDHVTSIVSNTAAPDNSGQYAITLHADAAYKPSNPTFVTITAGNVSTILKLKPTASN